MIDLSQLQPNKRFLEEIKPLLYDQKWADTAPDQPVYFMYRDLAANETDKGKIAKAGLRYDITRIPFIMLGLEFNKTAGHDHPLAKDGSMTYPEIYQVLSGQAIFLIQDSKGNNIIDVRYLEAPEKTIVVIPPNYEHIIINASGRELITANWISRDFGSNIYQPFRDKHGFSYFGLDKDGELDWLKNDRYDSVPDIKLGNKDQYLDKLKIDQNMDMYSLVEDLDKLEFLKKPEKFEWK